MRASHRGFTLIEVTTVLAMTSALCAIALPNFDAQLRKARRADALAAIVQIQNSQERLRSQGSRYGDLTEIGAASVSSARHYTLQATAFDANGYEVVATATGAQAKDADCRVMAVRAAGMNLTHVSGSDATLANPEATNRRCWSL